MGQFNLELFIEQLRAAARREDAVRGVRELMTEAFRDPDAIGKEMAGYTGEEEILFEDDSVSIWYCGFDPGKHVPPHDHQTTATIGVYAGEEVNHFYLPADGKLRRKASKHIGPGEVIAIGPDAIHSVETSSAAWSYAIHVYLAPLSRVERSLFDWDSGDAMPFNDDDFARLERRSNK